MSALALPQSLSGDEAAALLPHALRALDAVAAGNVWTVDAAALTRFDSAALALLLECRRAAQQRGVQLQVRNVPAGLQSMARVYGVDALLGCSSVGASTPVEAAA